MLGLAEIPAKRGEPRGGLTLVSHLPSPDTSLPKRGVSDTLRALCIG
jgi:hypothetical protein